MSPLELALGAAALLIGLTGAWSPCGFSMVETIGPTGHTGGRRTTLAACLTFAPGAVVGGIATFGLLAAIGALAHGAGGRAAYLVAAAIALAAAAAEVRGARIVPQIRRQLPEHWRRVMPMPVAAALYGVLLGLGFATFVLSFGVWALAGISLALGDPATGAVIGAGFGIGRAVPIALIAPVVDRPVGIRVTELMAERPALYRGFRLGDAVVLLAAAAVLTTTGTATAARTEATGAADPSFQRGDLAWQRLDRTGVLRRGDREIPLPGTDPALGGPYAAVIDGDAVQLLDRKSLAPVRRVRAANADAVAVSEDWLVHRSRQKGRDVLTARRITNPRNPGSATEITAASKPAQLGRPAVDGARLVYAVARQRKNLIVHRSLTSDGRRVLLTSRTASLSNPALGSRSLLYVKITQKRQSLMRKRLGSKGSGRSLLSRKRRSGVLWSTALSRKRAYVTLMRGGENKILSVGL